MLPQLVSDAYLWPGVAFRFCSARQEELGGNANTHCGFGSRETELEAAGREREAVTMAETDLEDLLAEVPSMVSRWCAQRSGPRSAPRNTEHMVQEVEALAAAG